jgi:hypothetical protein
MKTINKKLDQEMNFDRIIDWMKLIAALLANHRISLLKPHFALLVTLGNTDEGDVRAVLVSTD